MKTIVRKLDGLPIEEPMLDDEGLRRRKELAELAVRNTRSPAVSRQDAQRKSNRI
jgi:hypothetical protein